VKVVDYLSLPTYCTNCQDTSFNNTCIYGRYILRVNEEHTLYRGICMFSDEYKIIYLPDEKIGLMMVNTFIKI